MNYCDCENLQLTIIVILLSEQEHKHSHVIISIYFVTMQIITMFAYVPINVIITFVNNYYK